MGITRETEKEIICKCLNIDRHAIEDAIAHGASTVEKVAEATGATTGACGGERCRPLIEGMLLKHKN